MLIIVMRGYHDIRRSISLSLCKYICYMHIYVARQRHMLTLPPPCCFVRDGFGLRFNCVLRIFFWFYFMAWPTPDPPTAHQANTNHLLSKSSKAIAMQCKAMQSKAMQSKAMQSNAKQCKAKQSNAKQSNAKQNNATQSNANQSKAKKCKATQSRAKHCNM